MTDIHYYKKLTALLEAHEDFVEITQLSSRGHVPACDGAKALITKAGIQHGTVGGGKVEARAIQVAQEFLNTRLNADSQSSLQSSWRKTWNLTTDIGMTCGGEVEFLFEPHLQPDWCVVVFGAGHVGLAVVDLLNKLPCQIYCYDPRPEWREKLIKNGSEPLQIFGQGSTSSPEDLVLHLKQTQKNPQFVVMTQGHATDIPVLQAIQKHFDSPRFVGVIGSAVKGIKLKSQLKELGLPTQWIERIHTPIGLPLGSNHPYEIAVSVVAQLLSLR